MSGPVDAVARIVEQSVDADDVLRATVASLAGETHVSWAAVAFVEDGTLRLGPAAGQADEARRRRAPILYRGAVVGELWVDGEVEPATLEAIAALIAPYALIGWDTGGAVWDP